MLITSSNIQHNNAPSPKSALNWAQHGSTQWLSPAPQTRWDRWTAQSAAWSRLTCPAPVWLERAHRGRPDRSRPGRACVSFSLPELCQSVRRAVDPGTGWCFWWPLLQHNRKLVRFSNIIVMLHGPRYNATEIRFSNIIAMLHRPRYNATEIRFSNIIALLHGPRYNATEIRFLNVIVILDGPCYNTTQMR